jgi:hypothetical protein
VLRISAALVVLGLLALALAGILGSRGSPSPPPQLTGELLAANGGPLAVTTVPDSYRLVYRVETYDDTGKAAVSTEEVNIRRPFDGHVASKAGEPPGGTSQWDLVNVLGLISDTASGSAADVNRVPPGAPAGDIRLDAALPHLLDQRLFVSRERRRLLGRECQVYRTGQPLESAQVTAATNNDYADACIDASGLMLEEMSVTAGKLALRTRAVDLQESPSFPEATFSVQGSPTPLAQGGADLVEVDATKPPVGTGFWELPPPAGYQRVGRYLLRLPSHSTGASTSTSAGGTSTTTPPGPPLESYVDVFSAGSNFVVVQQGLTTSEPQSVPSQGTSVDLGKIGKAQFSPGVTGNTMVVHPATGWFVELQGTLSADALTQLAATLHPAA